MSQILTDKQKKILSNIPVSMSGFDIRVISAMEANGKNSLFDAIEEVMSGFKLVQGIRSKLIEDCNAKSKQILSRLNSLSSHKISQELDYRLVLFDGMSADNEVRNALKNLPIGILGLSKRAANTLEKKQIFDIYEAIIEIKTAFPNTQGLGNKTIDDSLKVIDEVLSKIEGIEPHLFEETLDPRTIYFKKAEGNFLSVFEEIFDLYFDKIEAKKYKERNKDIIVKRYNLDGNGQYSQVDLAIHYDLSRQRVEQVEAKVIEKIERFLSGELKMKDWRLDQPLINSYLELKELLHSKESLLLNSEILELLNNNSHGKFNQLFLPLLMKLLGYFRLPKTYTSFKGTICKSWCKYDQIKSKDIEALFSAFDIVFENPEPINFFDFIVKVKRKSKTKLSNDLIELAIQLCPEIEVNGDELFVKPEFLKSTTDKAYVILSSNGKAMHYSEILRKINALGNDNKTYKKLNLTNQLASDDRFVSIGKSGEWGLNKWGTINNSSVITIMQNVLHKLSKPTTSETLVTETQKIRPDAKENSIRIYLSNQEVFTRVSEDLYALAAWKMDSYQSEKSLVRFPESKFHKKAYEILKDKNPIPLAEFVKQMMDLTNLKEVSIRQKANHSKLLSIRPIKPRYKEVYCENLDVLNTQSVENEKLTVREEIHSRVLEVLQTKDEPVTKGELYSEVSREYPCLRPTFYRYLSEMNNVKQFNKNNKFYVEIKKKVQNDDHFITTNALQKLRDDIFKLSSDFSALKVSSESKNEQIDEIYRLLDKESEKNDISKYEDHIKSQFPKYDQFENNSIKFLETSYYLYDKLNDVQKDDYSPFVLQFSRVIENELLHKLFITFSRKFSSNREKDKILANELNKTKIFAKHLQDNNEKYTLGSMIVILGYVYKSNGNTLKNSQLLQLFRSHVTSIINSGFLCKKNIDLLSSLTNKYRNKAAHTGVITLNEAKEFSEIVVDILNSLLTSYK